MSGAVIAIVIAKEPLPGRCKTRLCPPLDPSQAARVAEAALADTLAAVVACGARRRLLVLDGRPGPWLPPGFDVVPQLGGGLGRRLAAAFQAAAGPALLVGMDTPQLSPALLNGAIRTLRAPGCDAVLGPAADGGYWAIGLRAPRDEVFAGVPMSTRATCEAQRRRLDVLGLRRRELAELRDVDTIEDARAVAALAPRTRFAAALRRCGQAGRPAREPPPSARRAWTAAGG
jgi:rSAM/selenodomain-associated transferase 1